MRDASWSQIFFVQLEQLNKTHTKMMALSVSSGPVTYAFSKRPKGLNEPLVSYASRDRMIAGGAQHAAVTPSGTWDMIDEVESGLEMVVVALGTSWWRSCLSLATAIT